MDLLQSFLNIASVLVLNIVVLFILYYSKKLITKYGEKLDTETASRLQDLVTNSIAQGCAFAEQWAKNIEKGLEADQKVASSEKLLKAIEYALTDLRKHGIAGYSEKEVRDKVESFLGIGTLNLNSMNNLANGIQEDNNEPPNNFLSD